MSGLGDSLSHTAEAGGLGRAEWGSWADCPGPKCQVKGPRPGPRLQGPAAGSVDGTSVVPSSGHVLHGDSKARRKYHCVEQIPEPWAWGAQGQVWRERGLE